MLFAIWYHLYNLHCVKSVQIRSFFLSVFSCIGIRKNSVFGHFLRSAKKCEKHPWKSVTFSKVLLFVQIIPNRATHHIYSDSLYAYLRSTHNGIWYYYMKPYSKAWIHLLLQNMRMASNIA